ncbi:MAG: SDR family oxidoreductase [Marinifilaceae bacterium]|jgi:2-C-methyl-D-erythritol 4-phosphate cytidylyltransferase|nr:SDR family oxidoreductase [Marinifilaceae bacterium]
MNINNRGENLGVVNSIQLEKKVVMVFGGSRGIGKAIVDDLTKEGCIVESVSKTTTNTDIASKHDIAFALQSVFEKHQRIDYVVVTAAEFCKSDIKDLVDDDIDNIIDVNLKSNVYIARDSYKYLRKTKGQLILFASSSISRGRAGYGLYSATKSAIANLSEAIADEWKEDEIRVNCISPSRTKTEMREKYFGIENEESLLSPKTISKIVIETLCSNKTGEVISIKLN